MKESQFLSEMKRGFDKVSLGHGFWYKPTDDIFMKADAEKGGWKRFTSPKPFDVFMLMRSPVAVEAKVTRGGTLPFKMMKPHQEAALRQWHVAGGRAYIVVRFVYRPKGKPRVTEAYAIPITVWDWMKRCYEKSVSRDELLKKSGEGRTDMEGRGTVLKFEHARDDSGLFWDVGPMFTWEAYV